MQNPTQHRTSFRSPGNTFDLNPKWARTLPSFIYFYWKFIEIPLPQKKIFKYQSWYLTPCCGLEVQKPTQALKSVKGPGNTFDLNLKWARTLPSFIENPLPQKTFKYQSSYLTPCCGLEVQKPTQVLKSVKGPGNTFDLNPKWARTLPSFIYFYWKFIETPLPQKTFKYQSSYLTPCCGLEVQKPTQALKSVKGPGNTFELNPKWTRTLPLGNLDFCTSSPQQGVKCQLQYLEFFWRGGLYKYTMKNSQRQSGHLTDLSCWVEFCTSNPKQGVQCQPRYLDFLFGRGVL